MGEEAAAARRVRVRDLGRYRRAHGRHARRRRACSVPDLTKQSQQALHDGLIPAYLRVSNPVDCGGPPVADARGRQILDVDPRRRERRHPRHPDHRRGRHVLANRSRATSSTPRRRPTKPIFVVWGAPPGTDDTYYKRLLDGGLPVFRTFDNCVDAVRAYQDYWTFAARYRSPFDDAPTAPLARREEGAHAARRPRARARRCRSGRASSCSRRTASSRRRTSSCARPRPRCSAAERDRLPGRDEGRRRPTCCTRATPGS